MMWIYYGLILLSVAMFGGGFAFQDLYRKKRGSGLCISMEASCIGAVAGLIVLLAINGFAFEYTPFTLLMASWAALNGMAFTFCTFRALDYINLSLFSLFSMLGGMVLPFFQGILFYGEAFTLAKGICVAFIIAALLCTLKKGEKKKGPKKKSQEIVSVNAGKNLLPNKVLLPRFSFKKSGMLLFIPYSSICPTDRTRRRSPAA